MLKSRPGRHKDSQTDTENNIGGILSSPTYNPAYKTAISISQTEHSLIACNTTDASQTGLQFVGACDYADIKNNEMKYHDDALALGVTSVASSIGTIPLLSSEDPGNIFTGYDGMGSFTTAALHSYDSYAGLQSNGIDIYYFQYLNSSSFIPISTDHTGTGSGFQKLPQTFTTTFDCTNDLPGVLYPCDQPILPDQT